MLKRVHQMNEEEKKRFVDIVGRTVLYIEEQRSLYDMANKLDLHAWQIDHIVSQMDTAPIHTLFLFSRKLHAPL